MYYEGYTMCVRVVPIRLDDEILSFVDLLVKLGIYSSRSEALRELIKAGIKSYENIAKIAKAIERLFELEKEEGDIPIKLNNALSQLLGERDRF